MIFLRAVGHVVEVDEAIAERARVRSILEPFVTNDHTSRCWRIREVPGMLTGHPLSIDGEELARLEVHEDELQVSLTEHALAGLAVLRAAWFHAIVQQGGLLVHGSAVAFGEVAVAAVGPSGSGKSTFARLCVESGRAALLSDEIIALMPDGRCFGTPFRSDLRLPGSVGGQKLGLVLSLTKADHEALLPARALNHARLLLSQSFAYPTAGLLSVPQRLERITTTLSHSRCAVLQFRKVPAVAGFVEKVLQ